MPRTVLRQQHLTDDKLQPKGTYLVVELIKDHPQNGLPDVPKGTRGIVVSTSKQGNVFLFPHDTIKSDQLKVWVDGDIRIVPNSNCKALGRINHK